MALERLVLTDFRSYREALLEPGSGPVILTGDNGAGKTNLLEAASLLSPGRGLRGATLAEMAREGGPGGFAVAARVDGVDLGTGTTAEAPDRRLVRINQAPASAASLAEIASFLWLTPAMDRLFLEGASGRRRFLDRLVLALEPGHAVHAARYEAAMRARNKLLGEAVPDPGWLDALEARMAEHGASLAEARARTVAALDAYRSEDPGEHGAFPRAALRLENWEAGGDLGGELRRGRARDAAAGRTLAGPHRADLAVTHVAKKMRAERCSTGEQKALLLSIVLAHAELVSDRCGRPPILLLDEVAAHLDARRRTALYDRLAGRAGQVWMTGTERSLFAGLEGRACFFSVTAGRVVPA